MSSIPPNPQKLGTEQGFTHHKRSLQKATLPSRKLYTFMYCDRVMIAFGRRRKAKIRLKGRTAKPAPPNTYDRRCGKKVRGKNP